MRQRPTSTDWIQDWLAAQSAHGQVLSQLFGTSVAPEGFKYAFPAPTAPVIPQEVAALIGVPELTGRLVTEAINPSSWQKETPFPWAYKTPSYEQLKTAPSSALQQYAGWLDWTKQTPYKDLLGKYQYEEETAAKAEADRLKARSETAYQKDLWQATTATKGTTPRGWW